MIANAPSDPTSVVPSFREAARFWAWLGLVNFGGPAAQIALMHAELVDRRRWIDEARFQRGLAFCMALPGPEAQQLAMLLGCHLHGVAGGVFAGAAFVVPSIVVMLGLSWLAVTGSSIPVVAGLLVGLQASVLGLVSDAILRMARRLSGDPAGLAIAGVAFAALVTGLATFPAVVSVGAASGLLLGRAGMRPRRPNREEVTVDRREAGPPLRRVVRLAALIVAAWGLPVMAVAAWRGPDDLLVRIATFFTWASFATFGGAYAVLAHVADQAVNRFGWLDAAQMAQGLGLAESTPGPLIMVVQFVGFVAAWNAPGDLPPLLSATLGGLLATWGTFLPGFLLVLGGTPWVDAVSGNRLVADALRGIGAAVVGVIGSLGAFFGTHLLATAPLPDAAFSGVVGVLAFVALRTGLVAPWAIAPVGAALGAAWLMR